MDERMSWSNSCTEFDPGRANDLYRLQLLVSLLARGKTPRKWGGRTGRSTM